MTTLSRSFLLALLALSVPWARADPPADATSVPVPAPARAPAAAEPARPTAPSLTAVLTASGVDIHGYLDTAYSYLSGTGVFTTAVADRVFDTEPNSFNLHQAALIIDYQPKEGFGGLVNLTAGRDARVTPAAGETTGNFDLPPAFLQDAHRPPTILRGKFLTAARAGMLHPPPGAQHPPPPP